MEVKYSYYHPRAQKARIGYILKRFWIKALTLGAVGLAISGLGFLWIEQAIGWLLIGLSALPALFVEWYEGELKQLPPNKRQRNLMDVMAGDVLALLPRRPSPKDLATAVSQVYQGHFFALRFGLTANFLQHISSDNVDDTQEIWERAVKIKKELALKEVTAGSLIVALVEAFEDHDALLAQLHLNSQDLRKAILWQLHIEHIVAKYHRPKRTGGIARDLTFGYIPLLTRFGQNISQQITASGGLLSTELEGHKEIIDQLVKTFSDDGRQNAVLVGSAGAGKTTIVHAFAEYLLDARSELSDKLKFRQVFLLDASSLLSAASERGELERLISHIFNEAYSAKNIIICLDNAQLFLEETIGAVDLTNLLTPILEAGNLRIILTMDEQRFLEISRRHPSLINTLNRINVKPAGHNETIAVMQDQLIALEYERQVTYTYQSLGEAYRLGERYVHDQVMPGRAIKLLESAAGYSEGGLVTMNSVRKAIEATTDIKVGVAEGEQEKETLLNLEKLIHERMVNQKRAVQVVSDALRRARAGVRNENRPIGTFLFLGPTGVGKTELAKALAEVYFGGEDRIIRLDLNEYVTNDDVARLIADGADDPSSLTAAIMKQPFSVILLDEIEKAHPAVLTTLLQMLDEGILRDVKNREVSFRDAIIITTSNAGADQIREYIERGHKLEEHESQFVDQLISSGQFKPEFLNRFDEIVLFGPLGKKELLQVVDRILIGVNKTMALQKITVEVASDAKQVLVERGYDPRLGARPMRRVVQRAVENTVAKQVLSGEVSAGQTVTITKEQVEAVLGTIETANAIADGATNESLSQNDRM